MRQDSITSLYETKATGSRFSASGMFYDEYVSKRTEVTKSPAFTADFGSKKKAGVHIPCLPFVHKRMISSPLIGFTRAVTVASGNRYVDGVLTPYSQEYVSQEIQGLITWEYGNPEFTETVSDCISTATERATSKLLSEIKDSKFNGAQAFAEANQTYKLIGDFTVKTAKVLENLRKGKLRDAGKVLGLTIGEREATRYAQKHRGLKSQDDIDSMLSSGVLSVQYGLRPLIADVIGAAELYAQKRVHEYISHVKKGNTRHFREEWARVPAPMIKQSATREIEVTVNIGCYFAPSGYEVVHTLAQLGMTNPLLLAWELMPWSFVIDWVLPVGDYLASLDATLGLSFIDGYKSVKVNSRSSSRQTVNGVTLTGDGSITRSSLANSSSELVSFERTILSSFPSLHLPTFKNPLSFEHALNGIALLAQFKKSTYSSQGTRVENSFR